jgi:prevent-host-death family protein
MTIHHREMTITVTDFKAHCLELLRRVEERGEAIEITRHGRVVARVTATASPGAKPWERLRGSGTLLSAPGEGVVAEGDFEALR